MGQAAMLRGVRVDATYESVTNFLVAWRLPVIAGFSNRLAERLRDGER